VGGALVSALRADGHDVDALVRNPAKASMLQAAGVRLVVGDLDDKATLISAATGADGLFHVAGWFKIGVRDRSDGERVNVDGTRAVLSAARDAGVRRIVYTSTLAVNSDTRGRTVDETFSFSGRHLSVYDETKARAHEVAQEFAASGLPVVTVMPGVVYGPGDTSQVGELVRDIVRGRRVVVPSSARLSWGYVDDIARGHVLAMERGHVGESYMLAGPHAGLDEALRLAAQLAGTSGPIVVPGAAVRATAAVVGVIERVAPIPAMYTAETLRSGMSNYLGTPEKAKRELGWTVRPLREGMTQTVRALQQS
jgi:nucleoside-diphosphate-sugar epimerase